MLLAQRTNSGILHESDPLGPDCVRGVIADQLRRAAPAIFLERFIGAMHDGGTALYRPVGGRTPEMDGSQMALRISLRQQQGRDSWSDTGRLNPMKREATTLAW